MASLVSVIWVAPSTDQEYLDAAKRVEAEIGYPLVSTKFGDLTQTPAELEKNEDLQAALSAKARVFPEFTFRYMAPDGPFIQIHREHVDPQGNLTIFERIHMDSAKLNLGNQARFAASVQRHFGTASVDYIGNLLGPQARAQFEAREMAVTRLETLASNLLVRVEEERIRRDAKHDERMTVLDLFAQGREKDRDEAFKERLKQQDSRDAELDEKKKQLDDAAAKDQRRKDFQKIKTKFNDWSTTYTVTAGTLKERKTIFWSLIWFLGGFFLMAAALTATLFFPNMVDNVYLTASRTAAWILFVSTALYFVRWNNAWFQRLANEEFRLKRLELDVERANWMIETASEWKEDKQEIPIELLTRMSAGLFVEAGHEEPVEHTAEILAKAIANASTIKVGPAGTELQWGKKDLNKPV